MAICKQAEGQGAGDVHLLTKEEIVVCELIRQQNQNEDRIELHPHRSDAPARRVCRPVQRLFEDMELEMRFVERVMEKSKLNFLRKDKEKDCAFSVSPLQANSLLDDKSQQTK